MPRPNKNAHARPFPSRVASLGRIALGLGIAFLALTVHAGRTLAQCVPSAASVTEGEDVLCSGSNTDAYTVPEAINEVTVTIDTDASFDVDGAHAVSVNDLGGIVNLGTVNVGTDATAGLVTGSDALIENFGEVNVNGIDAKGFVLGGGSQFGVDAGEATTGTLNLNAEGAVGVSASGEPSSSSGTRIYQWGTVNSDANKTIGLEFTDPPAEGILRPLASNRGQMTFTGDEATGVSGGRYADVGNGPTGVMSFTGSNSIGVKSGDFGSSQNNQGTIIMSGAESIALQSGSGEDLINDFAATVNAAGGLIEMSGENSTGMEVGRFGVANNGPGAELTVTGAGSTAIRSGAESSTRNLGTIRISGLNSIGVRVAGPDLPDPPSEDEFPTFSNELGGILISEDPEAGPLVLLEAGERPNHLLNTNYNLFPGGEPAEPPSQISAYVDEENPTLNRGVAIQGSAGEERISNGAEIQGLVLLGDGDDRYESYLTGELRDLGPGTLDGGAGTDTLELSVEPTRPDTGIGTFDLGLVRDFETIRVSEGRWLVSGAPTPEAGGQTDMTVVAGATLRIESPLSIPGDYSHEAPVLPEDPKAQVEILLSRGTEGGDVAILTVEGAADLSNGELEIELAPGVLEGGEFILIESGEDLTTQFDSVTEPEISISQESTLTYTTRGLEFTLALAPMNANQAATSKYLGAVPTTGLAPSLKGLVDTINNDLTYSEYLDALDQIMPEAYDAQAAATLELANQYTDLLLSRPNYCVVKPGEDSVHPTTELACQKRTFEPWMNLYGQRHKRTGTDGHISYHDEGGGLVVGFDHRVNPQLLLTASAGTAYDIIHVDNVGKGRLATVDIGLAASWADGPLRIQGAATYGYGWNTRYREIDIPDPALPAYRTRSEYGMNRIGLRGRVEYGVRLGYLQMAPLASLDYTALIRPDITETEGGPANLFIDSATDNITTIRVGLELGSALHKDGYWTELLENADGVWRPQLSVMWRQVVTGAHRDITSRFLGAPPGQTFTIQADAADRGFEIGAGLDWSPALINRFTFGIHYDAFVWEDVLNQTIMGQVRFSF